jgi:hypothetical protein
MNLFLTFGRTPWTGDQPDARPLPTQDTTTQKNAYTHTSMPLTGFEPTIPAFELSKTVRASLLFVFPVLVVLYVLTGNGVPDE